MGILKPSEPVRGATSAVAALLLAAALGGCGRGGGEIPAAPASDSPSETGSPADGAVLQVRTVTDLDGRPVAGVRVDAWWTLDQEPSRTTLTTGSEGEDGVLLPHGARLLELRAGPTALTAPGRVESGRLLRRGDVEEITLRLRPGATVRGVVVDGFGAPLADVRVAGFHRSLAEVDADPEPQPTAWARCDAEGRFHLGGFPPGDFVVEAVGDARVGTQRLAGNMPEAATVDDVELVSVEAHRVLGQVHDSDGAGIFDARVLAGRRVDPRPGPRPRGGAAVAPVRTVYVGPRQVHASSDADGLFRPTAVPLDAPWNVVAFHPRFLRGAAPIAPGEVDVFVQLDAAAVVEGTVRGAAGGPLADATVLLLAAGDELPRGARSDGAGRFLFGSLPPQPDAWLILYAEEHAPIVRQVAVAIGAPPLDLRLEAGRTLTGTLLDADGSPLADVPVELAEVPPPGLPGALLPLARLGVSAARTDRDGGFGWQDLGVGAYRLTAYPPGRAPVVFDDLRAAGDPLELRLRD
jgi:protocatechuate 3,4-dioxygenase beta subunit